MQNGITHGALLPRDAPPSGGDAKRQTSTAAMRLNTKRRSRPLPPLKGADTPDPKTPRIFAAFPDKNRLPPPVMLSVVSSDPYGM